MQEARFGGSRALEVVMRLVLSVVLAVCCAAQSAAAAEPLLTVEAKIPLGSVKGRIDHLAVDLRRQRLFVAELGNGSLGVVDLKAGKVLKRITGLKEPQGVAYAAAADLVYVASGGDGTVRRYKGEDFSPTGEPIKLGEDADNVRIAGTDRVIVGYGNGALATLDAASGRKLGEVSLPVGSSSSTAAPRRSSGSTRGRARLRVASRRSATPTMCSSTRSGTGST
jgi:hypothetical protein